MNAASSSSTERFTLSGPSATLDPRFDAYRGDLADVALASRLFAPHYAAPSTRRCREETPLFDKPDDRSEAVTQLATGEAFALLDIIGAWAWGYREADHRVGYVRASILTDA